MRAPPAYPGLLLFALLAATLASTRAPAADTDRPVELAPLVVEETALRPPPRDRGPALPPRTAVGNLDLTRTAADALPFTIYDRAQLARSGVVELNDFLQRTLLDSDPSPPALDQGLGPAGFVGGSTNVNLRGFGASETVVLVNGRRLPEVVTGGIEQSPPPPEVNFIPLNLVERIEVLPVSSAALYAGNAVGGVINIVLRSDFPRATTELTTTYTNALDGFDAPQTSFSLLHAQALRGGAVRLRFNASVTDVRPPTEGDLRHQQRRDAPPAAPATPVFRATPNVRHADLAPLFGPGTSPVTSVAPGADGTGGLAAFHDREGVRQLAFFDAPGGLATSHDSVDFPYGRRLRRGVVHGSIVGDVTSRLQLGLDVTHARTVALRGEGVLRGTLELDALSPLNPFGSDVIVTLNETAPLLGANYSQGRIEHVSAVLGAIVQLPADWTLALDAQYARNVTRFRGLAGADPVRWQELVAAGRYQPLRDTQVHGPPPEFYEHVLVHRGARDHFATLGDHRTLDFAVRGTHDSLRLPTGTGTLQVGLDYRRTELADYHDEIRYGDGTLADEPVSWRGRALERYSVFGELRGPLWPEHRLPPSWRALEADLAVRYLASDAANEANVAPTAGVKLALAGGFTMRASVSTANRLPAPSMSRRGLFATPVVPGAVIDQVPVFDPTPNERYTVDVLEAINLDLRPEAALTQSVGVIFARPGPHEFRATLDFIDTRKRSELVFLDAQTIVNLAHLFPDRIHRAPPPPGVPATATGRVESVIIGPVNMASRHSQHWSLALDYARAGVAGGRFEAYGRLLYFARFDQQVFDDTPVIDQLRAPDSAATSGLRYRANFGAGWSRDGFGGGIAGRYFHARRLPVVEWPAQGDEQIDPHWQFDAWVHADLAPLLPWRHSRVGLRGQLRIANLFGDAFPRYVNDASGAGVRAYGDWRGRVYSLSLTATY